MASFRDSIDARAIPPSDVVAGYGDGEWPWSPSWWDGSNGWDLHPEAQHLVVVVSAAHEGDGLDVERGDATPADVPDWVKRWKRATGWRAAVLYCNRETWPEVVAALVAAGIDPAGPLVDWWIASLDGTTTVTVPDGAKPPVAIQVRGSAQTGGNYDESIILDPSWVPGGNVTQGGFSSRDEAEAMVDEMYQADGHRAPESNDAREVWVDYAMTHGLQATVEAMAASPEFQTNNAALLRLLADYQAGRLGGSVLVPHDHDTPASTTGPAKPI